MKAYLDIVKQILEHGERKDNRTEFSTLAIPGVLFKHDMRDGFPLLTTKKVPFRLIASELEFFIKGITDKQWLIDRNNHIWDEWGHPAKAPYGHDEQSKKRMMEEMDLGPVYGFQWRHFNGEYVDQHANYEGVGVDQLKELVEMLKSDPKSRRLIVSAWNPSMLSQMALPPCHYGFQLTVIGERLHLMWNQRSVDTMLGLPFNIASYGLLLHLLSLESGIEAGTLTGFLGDTHIYEHHIEGAKLQLERAPKTLPRVRTENFTSIFDWQYTDTMLEGYDPDPTIKFDIAV